MKIKSLPDMLILASNSKYRKMLLQRLNIGFETHSPCIDETRRAGEAPIELVLRLAQEKSHVVGEKYPGAIVIGSDQVAVFENRVIGKPGDHATAVRQLQEFSGQVVEFLTAVSVRHVASGFSGHHVDTTRVQFRSLQAEEIERYLQKEESYDCAGAFKAESLGITLFKRISSDDPTALIGLPLIKTSALLRKAGLQLP